MTEPNKANPNEYEDSNNQNCQATQDITISDATLTRNYLYKQLNTSIAWIKSDFIIEIMPTKLYPQIYTTSAEAKKQFKF